MVSKGTDIFPPAHYEAIGRLVIACTRLDAAMTDLIAVTTYMDLTAALITVHHQQFSSKVDTLKALLDFRASRNLSVPPELSSAISRAKELYDFRSRLVHAAWLVGDKGTSPITERITARGKLIKSKMHTPTHKILQYAQEAEEIAGQLEMLRWRI